MAQFFKSLLIVSFLGLPSVAVSQGAQVPFIGLEPGGNQTIEVAADSLGIDQKTGKAVFSGSVVIGIEDMRLSADKVEVVYSGESADGGGPISSLKASGNVVFSNGTEAAEANEADFDIEAGEIIMTGDVILTQGGNALSGQRLRINLNDGTAFIEGRVQTILQAGSDQ